MTDSPTHLHSVPSPTETAQSLDRWPSGVVGLTHPSGQGRSARFVTDVLVELGFVAQDRVDAAVAESRLAGKPPEEILPNLLARFVPLAAKHGIGLVDAFTLDEANRLKLSLRSHKARIHIWTNDRALKRHEPDKEAHPYLW